MTKFVYSDKFSLKNRTKRGSEPFFLVDSGVLHVDWVAALPNRYVVDTSRQKSTTDTYNEIIITMLKKKLSKKTTLIVVGGGMLHDLGGFVAATFLRGIRWIYVPTTLVGMADSCIGGRCGLYFDGKDCAIGSNYPPDYVIIDYNFVHSLPDSEWAGGVCEIIKTALLSRKLLKYLEHNIYALLSHDDTVTKTCLDYCRKTKTEMLKERAFGLDNRAALKLGRTLGVALESIDGKKRSRGEYVVFGLVLEMSMFKADISQKFYDRVFRIIDKLSLEPLDFSVEMLVEKCFEYNSTGVLKIPVPWTCGMLTTRKIDEATMLEFLNGYKV